MMTMTLAEDRITVAGVDVLVRLGQRVRIDRASTPAPVVGVWLALDAVVGSHVTATVLDDESGVQQITFPAAHLSLLEDVGPSEQEGKALNALVLAVRMHRTQTGEFQAWKRVLAERAGELANEHEWCSVYDSLMEQFGLPVCRDQDFEVPVVIRTTVTISARSQEGAEDAIEWSDVLDDLKSYTPHWEVGE